MNYDMRADDFENTPEQLAYEEYVNGLMAKGWDELTKDEQEYLDVINARPTAEEMAEGF